MRGALRAVAVKHKLILEPHASGGSSCQTVAAQAEAVAHMLRALGRRDELGRTALDLAVESGRKDAIEFLEKFQKCLRGLRYSVWLANNASWPGAAYHFLRRSGPVSFGFQTGLHVGAVRISEAVRCLIDTTLGRVTRMLEAGACARREINFEDVAAEEN